jgi:hypothetical protein
MIGVKKVMGGGMRDSFLVDGGACAHSADVPVGVNVNPPHGVPVNVIHHSVRWVSVIHHIVYRWGVRHAPRTTPVLPRHSPHRRLAYPVLATPSTT